MVPFPMAFPVAYPWWAFALRGVLAILFGLVAIVWPDITLGALVILFGAYALVDGIFAIVGAVMNGRDGRWLPLIVVGLGGILVGLITLIWPGLSALALIYLVAAWAIGIGLFQIVGAIEMRKRITNEVWLILSGALSVLIGLYIAVFPGDGAVALVLLIGFYAIVFGVLLIMLGLNLRRRGGQSSGGGVRPGVR